ncbi:MAG TPA: putative ABC exporter domain-containing protein [Gemmatimonadaceae bacterium]|nr:putative ABC exporter domain-containing protein [Gemmatimonadaceae bacterium]
MVAGAFLYLTWTSLRNRVAQRMRQSRNPRYALALLLGAAYFYFIFWRNPRSAHAEPFPLLTDGGHLFVLGGLLLGAVSMWVFGGASTALAFSQAEASLLFPAPVSRRQLVLYKLIRGQLPLLFNVLIWLFLLSAGHPELPAWARGIGLWMLFCTIYLHRLGSSLVRTAWAEHGRQGVRRNALSLAVFTLIVAGVAVSLARSMAPLRGADGFTARVAVITDALSHGPAHYVLWPFAAVLAPVFATSTLTWLAALPAALLVLLVHVWWVLHTDTAFEEAALAATAARARRLDAMRGRGIGGMGGARNAAAPRKPAAARAGTGIPLAPTGHPAVAIVWKNVACLRRTAQQQQLLAPILLAAVIGFVSGAKLGPTAGLAVALLAFAMVMVFMGPMMLRGDLRQDLQHLAELKTLPFSGATVVAAEVLSVSIPLAVVQAVALGAAAVVAQVGGLSWAPPAMRIAILVGALPVLLAFNACSVTIQNGMPILFPGWARLGTAVPGGVEMMGQMILILGFYLVLLALLLLVPAAMAFVAIGTLKLTGPLAVVGTMVAGSAALAFELQGVMQLLGRVFERLEPSSVSG